VIIDAVVKKVQIDKDNQRLEVLSPKYSSGQPLAFLSTVDEGRPVKFITGWEDVLDKKKPFKINGGTIQDGLIGNSTLIRGMTIEADGDNTIYIVMDPSLF